MISDDILKKSVLESYRKIIEEIENIEDAKDSAEDAEKLKQDNISARIERRGARNPKKVEDSEDKNDADVDEEEDNEILKGKDKGQDKEDDKFSYKIPKEIPSVIKFDDIIDQLNHVRSGASIKDDQVKTGLLKYYENLDSKEKKDLFSMLSGFATIMNKVGDVEDAPLPQEEKEKKNSTKISSKVINKKDGSPIVVGESARKYGEYAIVAESNDKKHRCLNGKYVNFGSKRCVKDVESRIVDALDFRDSCSRGTEKRSHYNGLLKYLRMQLRAAQKINGK